jgi:hypothetical protein
VRQVGSRGLSTLLHWRLSHLDSNPQKRPSASPEYFGRSSIDLICLVYHRSSLSLQQGRSGFRLRRPSCSIGIASSVPVMSRCFCEAVRSRTQGYLPQLGPRVGSGQDIQRRFLFDRLGVIDAGNSRNAKAR